MQDVHQLTLFFLATSIFCSLRLAFFLFNFYSNLGALTFILYLARNYVQCFWTLFMYLSTNEHMQCIFNVNTSQFLLFFNVQETSVLKGHCTRFQRKCSSFYVNNEDIHSKALRTWCVPVFSFYCAEEPHTFYIIREDW